MKKNGAQFFRPTLTSSTKQTNSRAFRVTHPPTPRQKITKWVTLSYSTGVVNLSGARVKVAGSRHFPRKGLLTNGRRVHGPRLCLWIRCGDWRRDRLGVNWLWPWRCTPKCQLYSSSHCLPSMGSQKVWPCNLSPESRNHFHFFGTRPVFFIQTLKCMHTRMSRRFGTKMRESEFRHVRGCNDSLPQYIDGWFVAWIRTVRECTRIAPAKLHARRFRCIDFSWAALSVNTEASDL